MIGYKMNVIASDFEWYM